MAGKEQVQFMQQARLLGLAEFHLSRRMRRTLLAAATAICTQLRRWLCRRLADEGEALGLAKGPDLVSSAVTLGQQSAVFEMDSRTRDPGAR